MKGRKVLLPIPTFSTYYEAIPDCKDIIPYQLNPHNDYAVDVEDFINVVRNRQPDCVVLVNPNNPTGQLLDKKSIIRIHHELTTEQLLIVDESFIDFSSQDDSIEEYSLDYSNIIIIRSLSKDFGIAGLRVGYAVMSEERVKKHLQRGFLWNSNGIAYFFTELLADEKFRKKYQKARDDYNSARDAFYQELVSIGIDVTASQANFFMIKVADPESYFAKLLYTHGIYTRILNDKWGLDGGYLRIASKDRKENRMMINAIKKIFNRDK
jgi:histidinol-phosphate/aromatic aminotransferase/cobyric acid decarboxylase-like protein